jgi:hypothetical protein
MDQILLINTLAGKFVLPYHDTVEPPYKVHPICSKKNRLVPYRVGVLYIEKP